MTRPIGEILSIFTIRDLQTTLAIIDLIESNKLTIKDMKSFWIGYSKHLAGSNRYDSEGKKIKRMKRTPEEKAARKRYLMNSNYGRVGP